MKRGGGVSLTNEQEEPERAARRGTQHSQPQLAQLLGYQVKPKEKEFGLDLEEAVSSAPSVPARGGAIAPRIATRAVRFEEYLEPGGEWDESDIVRAQPSPRARSSTDPPPELRREEEEQGAVRAGRVPHREQRERNPAQRVRNASDWAHFDINGAMRNHSTQTAHQMVASQVSRYDETSEGCWGG